MKNIYLFIDKWHEIKDHPRRRASLGLSVIILTCDIFVSNAVAIFSLSVFTYLFQYHINAFAIIIAIIVTVN